VIPKHILVPTDFSAHADYALSYAIELATTFQAHLTLLHAFHLSPLTVGELPPAVFNDTLRDLETNAQQHLQMTLERIHQAGLQSDYLVVEGAPFQTIVDIARDKQIDLIVMGTHGRTGLSHVLMGSVAERVVRLAPCPVLVTRGKADTEEPQHG